MKVGFVSRLDPMDKKTWSGTTFYSYQQIKQYHEVEIFQYKLPKYLQEWLTTQKSFNKILFKKNTSVEFLRSYAKHFSKQLEKDLKKRPVDVLFVSASSQLIAYLKTDIPIIYMTDATFQQLQGYYTSFGNLADYNICQGIVLDKKAFQIAAHCMLASEWNKQSAIHEYGIDGSKISVIPVGANLDHIPSVEDISFNADHKCRLLFLGVEWDRKGGDIALGTFRILQEKGIDVHLHIIGCMPPVDLSKEKNIIVIPFLDKNKTTDFQQLHAIFLQTDFLLLPTRAECAGVVFCEASAYAIPSITTNTGGVSTYVSNGINGYTLSLEATGADYANKIIELIADSNTLEGLKRSSRKHYDDQLNWSNWGKAFNSIAKSLNIH